MGLTRDQRVEAIMGFRFTERQTRFLELVMRHGGMCVPRQYAGFAGVANGGEKCNAFFRKLLPHGRAVPIASIRHNDQAYSLVDCLSFVVMEKLGIHEALAVDSDFTHRFVARPGPRRR